MQMYISGMCAQDGTGSAQAWYVDIDPPGAGQMQYLQKAIFDRGNSSYFGRVPAHDIIISSPGSYIPYYSTLSLAALYSFCSCFRDK